MNSMEFLFNTPRLNVSLSLLVNYYGANINVY